MYIYRHIDIHSIDTETYIDMQIHGHNDRILKDISLSLCVARLSFLKALQKI